MNIRNFILSFGLLVLLAACSGGGGGDQTVVTPPTVTNPPPTAGIVRTGITAGVITGFGSIILNGVTYDTDDAEFLINSESGTQADLAVGEFVIVTGEINDDLVTGKADTVVFNDNVKGPVQSIDSVGLTLVVLGQTVIVDANTSFDDSIPSGDFAGIQVGDIVEVSGLVDANGAIVATRIELKPAGTVFEVLGTVSALDAAMSRFMINQLVVDYSSAMLDDFPAGSIENGQLVEVKGASLAASGELTATSVEFKTNGFVGELDDFAELEGFITRFVSSSDFDVAGVGVVTSANTVYEGGVEADLGLNIKVEVEGAFNATGQIVATKIDIRRAKAVRMEALIDSVTTDGLVVLGIPVTIDALTRLEDKSDAEVDPLRLSDLNAGDYVEVRGSEFPAGSGTVLATILEREDVDPDTELQGFVTGFTDPAITVLGVTIETGSAVFRDENDVVLSRAEFFNRLEVNSLVKASGQETSSTVIVAEEVEFEVED